jgi:peptidoglycan/xylan/chitin deacetylase (PgdA/CDA1 family)
MKLKGWLCVFMAMMSFSYSVFASATTRVVILCYHNLSPTSRNSMTMTPEKFESQLQWLQDNHFNIIPLQEAVAYLEGKRETLPEKSIVISVDDGWKSVYSYFYPIIKKHNIPVTLFIFPQTISSGKNSLTWEQLTELQQTGLFDVQSHTYDHPNFKQARRHMPPAVYEKYVKMQLVKSKQLLEEHMKKSISYLAWPFGIYDQYLEDQAAKAGYEMAFTIDARPAKRADRVEAMPRFMIIDAQSAKTFQSIAGMTS